MIKGLIFDVQRLRNLNDPGLLTDLSGHSPCLGTKKSSLNILLMQYVLLLS